MLWLIGFEVLRARCVVPCLRLGMALSAILLVAGCATQSRALLTSPQALPARAELVDTPYFPQESHQCGPASLAMTLGAAGLPTSPAELEAMVYVPARQGSLQPEMLAAARRQGAFAVTVAPRLDALLDEVAHGHPVLVLQNLGLSWLPRWHYAVAIGYDLPRREIILRSGPNPREVMPLSTFEHTWARSGYWGMMVMTPGTLPVTILPDEAARALVAMEKYASADAMMRAYQTASARWPAHLIFQLGMGNSAYRSGDFATAETVFRAASDRHPADGALLNNLAVVQQSAGRLTDALATAHKAVALPGPWQTAAIATREAIRGAIREAINNAEAP